jgi:peroxiredoxin
MISALGIPSETFSFKCYSLPGCVTEARYFRDLLEEFNEVGAIIIGISGQTVER